MIDMHCHVIPEIDDGSKSMDESIQIIEEAKIKGFTGIFATPHYFGEQSSNRENTLLKLEELRHELLKRNIEFELYEGNEVYMFEDIYQAIVKKQACTLNDTKYILVELPMRSKVLDLDNIIFKLTANGYTPIIAHPERYEFVQNDPNNLIKIAELGAHFQLNFTSLIGLYGKSTEKTAKTLLDHNFISFIGSDAHKKGLVYENMDKVIDTIKKYSDEKTVESILEINPKLVVTGKQIEKIKPKKYSKKMFDFMRY